MVLWKSELIATDIFHTQGNSKQIQCSATQPWGQPPNNSGLREGHPDPIGQSDVKHCHCLYLFFTLPQLKSVSRHVTESPVTSGEVGFFFVSMQQEKWWLTKFNNELRNIVIQYWLDQNGSCWQYMPTLLPLLTHWQLAHSPIHN